MRLISYLDRLQQKSEGALTLIWSRYSEMTLPGQRAVLPPFYCPLSCVSVSIVCLYSRCAFWQIHTVPIKLPMSSTSDWETRCGDGWQQVCFFWGGDGCLELLLMHLAQNTGRNEVIKREIMQKISYM